MTWHTLRRQYSPSGRPLDYYLPDRVEDYLVHDQLTREAGISRKVTTATYDALLFKAGDYGIGLSVIEAPLPGTVAARKGAA